MEVTVPWSKLDAVYQAVRDAALSTPPRSLLLLIFRTAISMEPACTSALRHGHLETHRFQKLTPSTELCGMSLNGPPFVLERTCRTTMVWFEQVEIRMRPWLGIQLYSTSKTPSTLMES